MSEPAAPSILAHADQGILHLTLNRPAVLNSFDRGMASALRDQFQSAANDPSVRVVVLTGAGRAFCAGQDLAEVAPEPGGPPRDLGAIVRESYNPVIRAIRALEKPVVCAVNGIAAGAGANLALACDLVLAAAEASFVQSFSKIGLIPDSGGTFFLPRLVGLPRATAMMMLGEKITAARALEMGMIYHVCDAATLAETTQALATKLAAMPTRGLGLTKRGLNASFANPLDAQLDLEEELQRAAGLTHDYTEGVTAFLEKRSPTFTGA